MLTRAPQYLWGALVALILIAAIEHRALSCRQPQGQSIEQNELDESGHSINSSCDSALLGGVRSFVGWVYDSRDTINALSTLAIAGFTAVLSLFTISLAGSTRRSADAAKEAADVARDTYIAGQRTWLRVYPVEVGPVTFGEGGEIRMSVSIEAENIGDRPALAVNLDCKAYQARRIVVTTGILERAILFAEAVSSTQQGNTGVVLMKGETHKVKFTFDVETDPATEARIAELEAKGLATDVKPNLSAAYCVVYKTLGSDKWRHSGHVMWIRKKDRTEFDAALGNVTADNLNVTVMPGHSSLS